ncbi:MAG: hypothetical protein JSV79_12000, partial [Armatimonadota bacterium]
GSDEGLLMADEDTSKREGIASGQQVDVPVDAAEDAAPLKRGPEEAEIVRRIDGLAEAARSKASGRYQTIRANWDLYLDKWDWTGKARWQSRVWIPRPFQITESAVSLYSAGLIPSRRWFKLEDHWRGDYRRERMVELLQRGNMERIHFYEMLRLFLAAGFIGGNIPVKVGVDSTGRIPEPSLILLDPLDVRLDWSGRNRFWITETEVDPWTLREWGEMGMFEMDRVEEVIAAGQESEVKERKQSTMDEGGPTIALRELWGDLASAEGELWIGNGTGITANGKLLRPLMPNPFRKIPLVIGQPLRVPFKVWAASLLEHNSGLARMMTELACGVLDAALMASIQAYQYDVDRIDPADLLSGFYPGKAIGVEELTAQGDGVKRFEPGGVPHDVLAVMELLDLQFERGTSIPEQTTGVSRPGGRRKTAREVERLLGQSMSIIRTSAQDLEISFFEPMLDRVLSVFAQVTARNRRAFFRPEVVRALGAGAALMMAQMKPSERERLLSRDITHRVYGMSGSIAVNEDLQRLIGLAAALREDPETWAMVRKRRLAERMVELHRQDPDELLYTEQEMQQMAARQAMQMQAARQAAGGWRPRGGGGMGRGGQALGEPRREYALGPMGP